MTPILAVLNNQHLLSYSFWGWGIRSSLVVWFWLSLSWSCNQGVSQNSVVCDLARSPGLAFCFAHMVLAGGFSVLPQGLLRGTTHNMVFPQREWWERVPRTEALVFYNLVPEVTCLHFCCSVMVTQINPGTYGRTLQIGVNLRRWGFSEPSWRLTTQTHLNVYRITL